MVYLPNVQLGAGSVSAQVALFSAIFYGVEEKNTIQNQLTLFACSFVNSKHSISVRGWKANPLKGK